MKQPKDLEDPPSSSLRSYLTSQPSPLDLRVPSSDNRPFGPLSLFRAVLVPKSHLVPIAGGAYSVLECLLLFPGAMTTLLFVLIFFNFPYARGLSQQPPSQVDFFFLLSCPRCSVHSCCTLCDSPPQRRSGYLFFFSIDTWRLPLL